MHHDPQLPVDANAQTHQSAYMRTTIDLPDELYRTLKTRAAISGVTMRDLIRSLLEQGLNRTEGRTAAGATRDEPLPVAIPARGIPITLTPDDIHRLEEEEDLERYERSWTPTSGSQRVSPDLVRRRLRALSRPHLAASEGRLTPSLLIDNDGEDLRAVLLHLAGADAGDGQQLALRLGTPLRDLGDDGVVGHDEGRYLVRLGPLQAPCT